MPFEPMGEVDVRIDRLGINGEGVGRFEGFTLFVDGALPGEKVRARVYEKKKTFARANVALPLSCSPHRTTPVCPVFGQCGGCQIMHLDYPQQLEAKRARVIDALQRIAKIDAEVLPCIASPQQLAYRNKIQLPLGRDNQLGLYERGTHNLIAIEKCAIHCALGEEVFAHIQRILKTFPKIDTLKHILIKTSVDTQQALVVLVTKDRASLMHFAEQIFKAMEAIQGVVQNINPSEGNVILGEEYQTLVGQGWIKEQLCGLHFKVSPASFFQVNPKQAQTLFEKVTEFAFLTGKETVLDAYCGVGTLSLILAKHAKEIIGIESVAAAISDAKENARRNQITNAHFLCGRAEEKIASLDRVDVAILNPPRKGCECSFLDALALKRPRTILYISCDPATLARDVQRLIQKGYVISKVQPLDMFPQTMHVECIVTLDLVLPFS